jgi:hypothetical protein
MMLMHEQRRFLPLSRVAGEGGSGRSPETDEGLPALTLTLPSLSRWAPPSPAWWERGSSYGAQQ